MKPQTYKVHKLQGRKWLYLICVMRDNQYYRTDTNEMIEKKDIYNVEHLTPKYPYMKPCRLK